MNVIRKIIRNMLGFSANEINGFLILLPLLIIILFSEPLWRRFAVRRHDTSITDQRQLDSLVALWSANQPDTIEELPLQKPQFRLFDPNTLSQNELQNIGFSEKLSKRIVAYRQKGGKFRIRPDLLKIYGMDTSLYKSVYGFIDLPEQIPYQAKSFKEGAQNNQKLFAFDINTADTMQLKKLPGIGPVLALRIIRYREVLGGFIHPAQLKEVYGLDSTVVSRMVAGSFIRPDFQPKQINLNTADEKQLAAHPYISKTASKAIVAYRFQHGGFKNVEDIRKLAVIRAEDVDKMLPYLKVED